MSQCTVLLKNIWSSERHNFHSLHYIHQNVQRLPWVIENQLEPFQWLRGSSRCVLLSDSSSLAYWNLHWTYKGHIFCHNVINDWSRISKKPNYFRCLSVQREDLDDRSSSIILRSWFQHREHFKKTVYWKHQAFSDAYNNLWRRHSGKFKLKFIRILMTHPVKFCGYKIIFYSLYRVNKYQEHLAKYICFRL